DPGGRASGGWRGQRGAPLLPRGEVEAALARPGHRRRRDRTSQDHPPPRRRSRHRGWSAGLMRRALLLLALLLAPSLSAAAAAIEVRPVPVPDDPRLVLVAAPGPAEAIARDLAEDLADDWRRIEAILGLSDPRPVEIR